MIFIMRLHSLQLWAADLPAQHDFYTRVLELPVLAESDQRLELQAGATRLIFQRPPATWSEVCTYHFAFNIPENLFDAARVWWTARAPLLLSKAGEATYDFTHWNAHAFYFADAVGNILEFIARHALPNAAPPPFSSHHMLNISEIGLATDDVLATAARLQTEWGIDPYRAPGDTFAPIGDEEGLLIVVKRGREWFPDTGRIAGAYPVWAELTNARGELKRLEWDTPR